MQKNFLFDADIIIDAHKLTIYAYQQVKFDGRCDDNMGYPFGLTVYIYTWANYALKTAYYIFEQCSKIKPIIYAQNYARKIKLCMLESWLLY